MTKQEFLECIIGYLPYGLECEIINEKDQDKEIGKAIGIYNDGSMVFGNIVESDKGFHEVKPLLRPMSQLTEEITVDGETFVPIEKLGKLLGYNGYVINGFYGWGESTSGDDCPDYYLIIDNIEGVITETIYSGYPEDESSWIMSQVEITYLTLNLLYKWHFDIHDLIGQGLADHNQVTIKDNREQPDNRQQCYKTGEDCKYKCSGLCKESC